jgi:protein-disulfide isomerase
VSRKGWIVFAVLTIGLLVALVIASRNASPPIDVSNVNENTILAATEASGTIADQVYGNKDAKVILVEYGDLQCPACGAAHPNLKIIAEEYKDQLAFVFRNFPLTTLHPNARAGSAAVEAAGFQGKYWEMNNYLYEHQDEWTSLTGGTQLTDKFVSYAEILGLDSAKFTTDAASSNVNQKISFDQALGKKVNVDSTPTLYLNGVKVEDAVIKDVQSGTGDKLRALIDADLTKAGVALPTKN